MQFSFLHKRLHCMQENALRKKWTHFEKWSHFGGWSHFFLINHVEERNGTTFESGTKIVPQEELSYGRPNGSSRQAVFAPFFSV